MDHIASLGVTPVTFEVRYYYIHSTAFDRVESCVRVRHHRHDRASHSDRLMRHAAHVRVHLIAHVTIAPLHACSRSHSRVQASARDSMHACLPTSIARARHMCRGISSASPAARDARTHSNQRTSASSEQPTSICSSHAPLRPQSMPNATRRLRNSARLRRRVESRRQRSAGTGSAVGV